MIRVKMIDHIVLRTEHVDTMIQFYSQVLGCKVERALPDNIGLTQLRAGKSLIDIVNVHSEMGRAGGGAPSGVEKNIDHFCLQIEAISKEDLTEWLESHGVEVGDFELRYGADAFGSSVYIRDPDKNIVELRLGRFHTRPVT